MAVNFLLKRSTTASKRPTAAQLDIGELSLNYDAGTAGVFFEDSAGAVRKIGPAEVSATAPNASPAGSSGNSLGELWYDTAIGNLKIFDGTSFVDATTAGAAGGSDTQVQFNSTGSLAGSANFTFNGTTASIAGLSVLGTSRFGLAATQDAIELLGRNGGTSNFRVALRPATLSANRTQNLQNLGGVVALDVNKLSFFAATTSAELAGVISDETGSGALVFATSPTLVTPVLGVATGTSFNSITGLSSTNPAALGTVAVGTGTTTARADHVHPTTGLGLTSGTLAQFAATTSAELAGVISDETGSGLLVFNTSPSLTTPAIGAATGTSLVLTGSNTASSFIPTGSTVPTNGLYLPAANSVAISTNGSQAVSIDSNGNVSVTRGGLTLNATGGEGGQLSLSNPTNTINTYNFDVVDDSTARIFTTENNVNLDIGQIGGTGGSIKFYTAGSQRIGIGSSGNVGIGVTVPGTRLDVAGTIRTSAGADSLDILQDGTNGAIANNKGQFLFYTPVSTNYIFHIDNVERLRLDSSGRLGLGTSSPGSALEINAAAATSPFIAKINNAESARIDSSGRLLVGTSSALTATGGAETSAVQFVTGTPQLMIANRSVDAVPAHFIIGKSRGTANQVVVDGDSVGLISFQGADGTNLIRGAEIRAVVDGTPGANDMPGRLVFSTTADGASSPTERMRIDNVGTTTLTSAATTAPFIAKISTSEVARIDSSGRLLVGLSTAVGVGGFSAGDVQQQLRTTTAGTAQAIIAAANNVNPATLFFAKARSTSNAIVNDGDALGNISFVGANGSTLNARAAVISASVDGTPSSTSMPGRLAFFTTPAGFTSGVERIRINSAGNVGIGVTLPGARLDVAGTIRSSSGADALTLTQDGTNGSLINTKGNFLFFTPAAANYVWHVDGVQKLRLGPGGDLAFTQTPGVYTTDVTGGATSIANNGTVDFSNASGMLVVNSYPSGAVTIYLCGGGSTDVVSSRGVQVGTFAFNVGIGGYTWTNNSGSTATFGFFFLRTRPTA